MKDCFTATVADHDMLSEFVQDAVAHALEDHDCEYDVVVMNMLIDMDCTLRLPVEVMTMNRKFFWESCRDGDGFSLRKLSSCGVSLELPNNVSLRFMALYNFDEQKDFRKDECHRLWIAFNESEQPMYVDGEALLVDEFREMHVLCNSPCGEGDHSFTMSVGFSSFRRQCPSCYFFLMLRHFMHRLYHICENSRFEPVVLPYKYRKPSRCGCCHWIDQTRCMIVGDRFVMGMECPDYPCALMESFEREER